MGRCGITGADFTLCNSRSDGRCTKNRIMSRPGLALVRATDAAPRSGSILASTRRVCSWSGKNPPVKSHGDIYFLGLGLGSTACRGGLELQQSMYCL